MLCSQCGLFFVGFIFWSPSQASLLRGSAYRRRCGSFHDIAWPLHEAAPAYFLSPCCLPMRQAFAHTRVAFWIVLSVTLAKHQQPGQVPHTEIEKIYSGFKLPAEDGRRSEQ